MFCSPYLNVLERILLDGDFHDFCGPKQAPTLPNSDHEWHMKHSIVNLMFIGPCIIVIAEE